MAEIKKIAVAVDFSDTSVMALKTALELGKQFDTHLDVLHCKPVAPVSLPVDDQPSPVISI